MTQIISTRRHGAPDRRQCSTIHPQSVTDIIQADRMRQLGINQGGNMTPRSERPALFIHPIFFSQLVNQMRRNKIAYLLKHSVFFHRWNDPPFVFTSPSLFHDGRIIPAFSFSMGC